MKIGILTLYGYFNYGNRFQNYAVNNILRKYGFETETFVFYNNLKPYIRDFAYSILAKNGDKKAKRYDQLRRFSKKYIPIRVFHNKDFIIPSKIAKRYDYFVVGSDQVWNPYIRQEQRENYFLNFAEKSQKVCISPSFGVKEISGKYVDVFTEGLSGFEKLSSREQEGVDIIKKLTGKEATLLIDPTLALRHNDWKKIYSPRTFKAKSYILNAFIGSDSEKYKIEIIKLAKVNKLDIIDVFDEAFSPSEVLSLLDNADLVCTDSFHFSAFSINFNRPFIVFKRSGKGIENTMFSRLKTLTKTFELESRLYENIDINNALTCDFDRSNEILANEREKFYDYLNLIFVKNKEEI